MLRMGQNRAHKRGSKNRAHNAAGLINADGAPRHHHAAPHRPPLVRCTIRLPCPLASVSVVW